MIVAKFGGSSLRDTEAFGRCLEIIKKNPNYQIIVASATFNTTNELEAIFSDPSLRKKDLLLKRHMDLAHELGLSKEIYDPFFEEIKLKLDKYESRDELLAQGELMSSFLLTHFLKKNLTSHVLLVDARTIIKTNVESGEVKPNTLKIIENCKELLPLKRGEILVTQGFIGSLENGMTTTLGREGSDYSATLLGRGVNALEVHIWTDVAGVYSCDPRLIEKAFPFKHLSFDQAELMALQGAKVLFPQTLAPLKESQIILRVKSTLSPNESGTCISCKESFVTALAVEDKFISIIGPHDLKEDKLSIVRSESHLSVLESQNLKSDLEKLHNKYILKNY